MDISSTIIPKSDQLNAEDMLSGPMTVTVESVSKGNAEQPIDIHLVETPGRAYRPSKTMRRVIVQAWGKESDAWTGRSMTLYRDPDVKFGGQKVGGIKISHMSHIDKAFQLALTETRGKRALHSVDVLTAPAPKTAAPKPTQAQMRRLAEGFTTAGITDSPDKARFIAETIGRTPNGWDDLTPDDVAKTIDALAELAPTADTLDSFAGEG